MKSMRAAAILVIAILLTACGGNETENKTEEQTNYESEVTTEKTEQSETPAQMEAEDETKKEEQQEQTEVKEENRDIFSKFEDALAENGIEYEEKVTMAAELVGAEQGIKYMIGDGAVELYRFDTDSDAYAEAEETQSLMLDGYGAFQATVRNGMALMVSDLEEEKYIEIFDSISE